MSGGTDETLGILDEYRVSKLKIGFSEMRHFGAFISFFFRTVLSGTLIYDAMVCICICIFLCPYSATYTPTSSTIEA